MDKICGIYKIQSRIRSSRIYIGSSVDITRRWSTHLSELIKGSHHNSKVQNHCNKYGISDLVFSIILYGCKKEDLIFIEQIFLDIYKPWFNVRKTAESNLGFKHSFQSRKKIGDGHRGKKYRPRSEETIAKYTALAKERIGKYHMSKESIEKRKQRLYRPILYYDIYGNFVKKFVTVKEASLELYIPVPVIYKVLKGENDAFPAFKYEKNIG
jgi:group I intron endonuclease